MDSRIVLNFFKVLPSNVALQIIKFYQYEILKVDGNDSYYPLMIETCFFFSFQLLMLSYCILVI